MHSRSTTENVDLPTVTQKPIIVWMPYTGAEAIRQRMGASPSAHNLLPASLVLQTRYHTSCGELWSDHANVMPSDLAFEEATLHDDVEVNTT
jgi:hypothetical protein